MSSIRRGCRVACAVGGLFLLASCAAADGTERIDDTRADEMALAAVHQVPHKDLCDSALPGEMRCHAKIVTNERGEVVPMATPQGYGVPDLQAAYGLKSSGGNGKTIAIVDAYDAPNAEADLGKYRQQYGLPACTTANGCFKKVNQQGVAGSYPTRNSGWAGEIALDLDMASAGCPDCKILLVEAD